MSEVILTGKLVWPSLISRLPTASVGSKPSPLSGGHEAVSTVAPGFALDVQVGKLLFATAEATVALAMVVEQARSLGCRVTVASNQADAWSRDLNLNQLSSGVWSRPQPNWKRPAHCHCISLRRVSLASAQAVTKLSSSLASTINLLPDDVLFDLRYEICAAVDRVAREAFANILEHAYPAGQERLAYMCATVSPPSYSSDEDESEFEVTTSEEKGWFKENSGKGLVLEIAIGDCGLGVPATLQKAAQTKKLELLPEGGHNTPDQQRRFLHQQLCRFAFHHSSTRKGDEDFKSPAAKLNWRGLHRCVHSTEHLGGTILLSSGAGRAGYAFVKQQMRPLGLAAKRGIDLPGTMIVLRFSTSFKGSRVQAVSAGSRSSQNLQLTSFQSAANPTSVPNVELTFDSTAPQIIGLSFPFSEMMQTEDLVNHVTKLPSGIVAALLLAEIPETTLAELRATSMDWESCHEGFPRLLLVWRPDGFRWKIAGSLPVSPQLDTILHQLESTGSADLSSSDANVRRFAHELATTYPHFLHHNHDSERLRFVLPQPAIDPADFSRALTEAFEALIAGDNTNLYFVAPLGHAYLLPTGRLVRKFISALHLIRTLPVLRAALSHSLSQLLEQEGNIGDLSLVVDGPTSYFLASALIRNLRSKPRLILPGANLSITDGTKAIVFVDVVFSTETVGRLVADLRSRGLNAALVIAALDLRKVKWPQVRWRNDLRNIVRIRSLLPISFDPEVLPRDSALQVIEIDAVTHAPAPSEASPFVALGTSPARDEFLSARDGLFTSGFHRIGGRVHSVSLSTGRLVEVASNEISGWIVSETASFLAQHSDHQLGKDVVLFSRPESHIAKLAERVGRDICRQAPQFQRVFIANLTVTPFGARPVFPRQPASLLADVREILSSVDLFAGEVADNFFGIYLDDAAISGNSLRDFYTKAGALETPIPGALLGVLIVNRMSPGENRFLDLHRQIASAKTSAPILTELRSLFRLQVRLADRDLVESVSEVISQIYERRQYYDDRLRSYVDSIRERADRVFRSPQMPASLVVRHPFYPTDDLASENVSVRAIRIRHLLALQQQNEGVIAEILKELSFAQAEGDVSILSMLALEPYLLKEDPIVSEGSQILTDLCLIAIRGEYSAQTKSDAIAVFAMTPSEFLPHLTHVLRAIKDNDRLVSAAAVFLLALCRRERSWQESILQSIDEIDWTPSNQQWLRDMVNVPDVLADKYLVDDELTATNRIHSLVSATWTHLGLQQWQEFDGAIKALVDEPDSPIEDNDTELARTCLEYADRSLNPGLGAIHYFALHKPDLDSANKIFDSLLESTRAQAQIGRIIVKSGESKNDPVNKQDLQNAWNRLRRSTLKAASPLRFLGQIEPVSADPSTIEKFLPMFFSSPHLILRALIVEDLQGFTINIAVEPFENKTVVVKVPTSAIHHVLEILLGNVSIHGEPEGRVASVSIDSEATLSIVISNRIRKPIRPATRRGVRLVQTISERERFLFATKENGSIFTAQLKFLHAMVVTPDLNRR